MNSKGVTALYNRFLPGCPPPWCKQSERPPHTTQSPEPPPKPPEPSGFNLSSLLSRFHLGELDKGDLLLMLVLMLLFAEEGENFENLLVIALAFFLS